jgi:GntR family transcriptional regulator
MLRLGLEPSTKLIDTSIQEADGRVPELLGIPTGAPVLVRRRHMFADNRLVQLATSYLPMDVVGSLWVVTPDINPAKLYERLADKGYRATSWVEEVEVRRADSEEAPLLGVAEGQPVFEVIRQMNADDRVLDVAVNVLAAYRWRLVYAWDGE